MPTQIIELFGLLVATFIGFGVPLFAVLLSLFPAGVKKLRAKYENEKTQIQDNIKLELEKKEKNQDKNIESILKSSLKLLEKNRKAVEHKLYYLTAGAITNRIVAPLILSLILTGWAFVATGFWLVAALALSLTCFVYSLTGILQLLKVFTEVREMIAEEEGESQNKVIELLSNIVEVSNPDTFVEAKTVVVSFNEKDLKSDLKVDLSVNKQYEIPIGIRNRGERMLKNVELGLTFAPDVVIEETPNVASIYKDDSAQIVRFKEGFIQANTLQLKGKLKLSFLKSGTYPIKSFIKGENIKNKEVAFSINVID